MAAAVNTRDARVRWRAALLLGALIVASAVVDVVRHGLTSSHDRLALAAAWIAGLALAAVAARVARRHPRIGVTGARVMVMGAAASAVPSALAWLRAGAGTSHSLADVGHALLTERLAPFFTDVNAAGSFFALFAVAAVWLCATARRPWWWAAPVTLLLLALWLTGSRTALASVLVVLPAAWIAVRRPNRRGITIACVSATVLLSCIVLAPPMRVPQASSEYALRVRVDMARVAIAIAIRHPVFGVGLGHFQEASVDYITPDLVAYFPPAAAGENAHNNFLQILAELGVSGLAAFLWLIAIPFRSSWQAVRRGRARPELVGLAGGVAAFLLTCLTGHPLLSARVTLTFLLALGLMFGLAVGTGGTTARLEPGH